VIVTDYSAAYGLKLVQAIEEQSAKSDYHIVIKRSYGLRDREEEAIRLLAHLGVSGLIIFPVHGDYILSTLYSILPTARTDCERQGNVASLS
jgi:GntR family transcriptional regulator, arabinose operon transcriptional repressor